MNEDVGVVVLVWAASLRPRFCRASRISRREHFRPFTRLTGVIHQKRQIAEEFSHTVLHRRRSGNSSPVSALSAVASPEARVRQPLLPENPPRRPSPSSVLERKDSPPNPSILQNGIAAAVGGKAFAVKGHELGAPLGAEGNEALREANRRKKEINAGGDGIRAQGARHPVKRGGSDAEKKLVAARQAQYRQQRRKFGAYFCRCIRHDTVVVRANK